MQDFVLSKLFNASVYVSENANVVLDNETRNLLTLSELGKVCLEPMRRVELVAQKGRVVVVRAIPCGLDPVFPLILNNVNKKMISTYRKWFEALLAVISSSYYPNVKYHFVRYTERLKKFAKKELSSEEYDFFVAYLNASTNGEWARGVVILGEEV